MLKLTRRETLVGLVALGAGAVVAERGFGPHPAAAATAAGRLDVHHHYLSPAWKDALLAANIPGTIAHMNWSIEGSLASMDGGGVETAILSTTNPGI